MHDACLDLQCASDSQDTRRFGQDGIATKHRRPQHHIDESRLIFQREEHYPLRRAWALPRDDDADIPDQGSVRQCSYLSCLR